MPSEKVWGHRPPVPVFWKKLVSAGFLERKKAGKRCSFFLPHDAVSLITVLPEQLQSPLLTAEWEYRLGEIERGQLAPEEFLAGISTMLKKIWWGLIRSSRELSTCSLRPVRWWANALAAAVKLQNCKKASSVRMILANLQSGKITNGGLPRKNSRLRLWCLHCLTMAVSV